MTLATPRRGGGDPAMAGILGAVFGQDPANPVLGVGMIQSNNWSPEFGWRVSQDIEDWSDPLFIEEDVPLYSVCDSPQQFMDLHGAVIEASPTTWCCFFVHVEKDPGNAGRGGGWRWHKWGEYIGTGEPDCEYLDDELGFDDGVWTANVLRVLEPEPARMSP